MPGCVVVQSPQKKGFVMKCFPKDPKRRKEWAIKMRRDDWFPTDYTRLCEAQFAPDMWEVTREDGSRKLKVHAVPTIFGFMIPKPKSKAPTKRERLLKRLAVSSISQAGNKPNISNGSFQIQVVFRLMSNRR